MREMAPPFNRDKPRAKSATPKITFTFINNKGSKDKENESASNMMNKFPSTNASASTNYNDYRAEDAVI